MERTPSSAARRSPGRYCTRSSTRFFAQRVSLEGMLLKPNAWSSSGNACATPGSEQKVAIATLRCLRRHVPAAVPGIVFLSGGQDHVAATAHLSAINQLDGPKPWKLSYSYGRALQDEALKNLAWEILITSMRANSRSTTGPSATALAALGRYTGRHGRGCSREYRLCPWNTDGR